MTNAIRRLISGGIAGIRDVVCDPKPEDSAGRMLERQDPSRRRKGKRAGIRSGAEHMGAPRPDLDRRRRSGASWRSARRISNSHPGLSGGGGVTMAGAYGVGPFLGEGPIRVSFDPTRVAAQVVTGIGFLGAGAIMRQGVTVRGLTTAAALWVTAAIGTAAGLGYWGGAIAATVTAVLSLYGLKRFEKGSSSV